jgi:hypothetical protein
MHALLSLLIAAAAPALAAGWTPLAEGVEQARLPFVDKPLDGDGLLDVVRIDPRRAALSEALAAPGDLSATAQAWAKARGLLAVINAGMLGSRHCALHDGAFGSSMNPVSRQPVLGVAAQPLKPASAP